MMPPEVDKDDDSAWGRAERWTAVQGQRQEVVFQGERGPKKRRSGRSGKTKQIAKKILNLQPLILGAEAELERRVGHPLSRADKLKDETLGSLMRELVQLKKEQKELKEKEKKEIPQTIEEVRKKVESNMTKLRKLAGRPHSLEEMSLVEQEAEKADLVSQLELVEVELGELVTRGDRHSRQPMADLFLRLRTLKKTTRRPSSDSGEFLEDIPEHETIQVVTTTNRNRRVSLDSTGGEEEQEEEEDLESEQEQQEQEQEQEKEQEEQELYNKHEEEEVEWHTMNESELIAALKEMKEQKRRLRKVIQEFESRLCLTTGRKISKEDKEPFRPVYKSYKKTKSRIKLVDALLLKYNSFPNII